MQKDKRSLYEMGMTTFNFVTANSTTFSTAANTLRVRLGALLTSYFDKDQVASQLGMTTGLVAQKEAHTKNAGLLGGAIAGALFAIYRGTGNLDAAKRMQNLNTPAKVTKGNLEKVLQSLKEVQTAATAQATALATYGIPAATLTAYAAAITALDAIKTSVNENIKRASAIRTKELPALAFDIRKTLEELDGAALILASTNPSVYGQYKASRNVFAAARTRTKAMFVLLDADGAPVLGAVISAKERGGRNPKTGEAVQLLLAPSDEMQGKYELAVPMRGTVDVFVNDAYLFTYGNVIGKQQDLGVWQIDATTVGTGLRNDPKFHTFYSPIVINDVQFIGGTGQCWPDRPRVEPTKPSTCIWRVAGGPRVPMPTRPVPHAGDFKGGPHRPKPYEPWFEDDQAAEADWIGRPIPKPVVKGGVVFMDYSRNSRKPIKPIDEGEDGCIPVVSPK